MESRYDAYCGLYCGACKVRVANENGTLAELAKEWEMPMEQLICFGCKSEQVAPFCQTCEIKKCARDKGIEFCYECGELPCQKVTAFMEDTRFPYHLAILKNLERIGKVGVDAWLQEQDVRWRCPNCHTKFSWWDESCKSCGCTVSSYKADI